MPVINLATLFTIFISRNLKGLFANGCLCLFCLFLFICVCFCLKQQNMFGNMFVSLRACHAAI
ncbi:hypothetical protein BDR06DRAFT_962559 [Suillus hirtellus]|nr:hypothetical protein BDR06DRAFT_962559 [Suillus hirtellus]